MKNRFLKFITVLACTTLSVSTLAQPSSAPRITLQPISALHLSNIPASVIGTEIVVENFTLSTIRVAAPVTIDITQQNSIVYAVDYKNEDTYMVLLDGYGRTIFSQYVYRHSLVQVYPSGARVIPLDR